MEPYIEAEVLALLGNVEYPILFQLFLSSLWPVLVVTIMVPSIDRIELFNHLLWIVVIIIIIYFKSYHGVQIIFITLEHLKDRITYVK